MKLGRLPARHDPRTLLFGALLGDATRTAPDSVAPPVVADWGALGNLVHADCTAAACAHLMMNWHALERVSTPPPSEADVLTLYGLVNGGVDQGAVGLDVMNAWRQTGLAGDRIAAFTAITPANLEHVKLGVWQFGGVWAGLNLPTSAQAQGNAPWTVFADDTGHAAPGSWGGHAVAVVGYDAQGLTAVTWGRLQRMSWEFWAKYGDEAWCCFDSTDWLGDVPGFRADELQAALAAL